MDNSINFDSYLPHYRGKIQEIYSLQNKAQPGYEDQKYIPLVNLNLQDLNGKFYFQNDVEPNEVKYFVGLLFSTNLLSQVIRFYGGGFQEVRFSNRVFLIQNSLEKRLVFPEVVKGLLGNWNYHVCPSVLPLMFLYIKSRGEIFNPVDHQNRDLARQTWIQNFDLFKSSVDWIIKSLSVHMQVLCGIQVTDDEAKEIQVLLLQHFSEIDVELRAVS